MPLDTSFTKFLEEKHLMHSDKMDKLRGTRIAIDAHNWMKVLTPKINEPYQAVMGGVPLTMGKAISQELEKFKKAGITPIFVFNGLPMILTQSPKTLVRNAFLLEIYEKREQAWNHHHEGKTGCRQLFEQAGSTITSSEFQHNLIRILRENRVEFFKAPYMAWAQMAYWCHPKERCVHQIQGPNELIMFEHVEVLLLEFHFDSSEFDYIIKSEIKKALMADSDPQQPQQPHQQGVLSDSQFLDCCLLTGLKGQIKHPRHFNSVQFVKIAQTLQKFGNACDFIMSKPFVEQGPTNQQLAKNHMRIRAVIRHSVVFTLDGQCQPMTHATARDGNDEANRVPCNLSDLWGHRLPNILYFFLSIGAIQTQVLINVVQNQMIETIPQMDTEDYRHLLHRILPLRTQIAHQLIYQLGERDEKYYVRGTMMCWRWFHEQQTPIPQPPPIKLDEWAITHAEILREKKKNDSKLDFLFVVKNFASNAVRNEKTYMAFEEVVCAIHLKALDLLGYFTHATTPPVGSAPTEPASGLSKFSEALKETDAPEFSEYAVLLIELFRTKALTCRHFTYMKPEGTAIAKQPTGRDRSEDPWSTVEGAKRDPMHFPKLKLPPVYMDESKVTRDSQKVYEQCCLLISRIWSLLPMELEDNPWFADVSKDLLAFNTIVKALHKTLRNLIEVVAAVLFLESRTAIDPYHYYELPQNLPFGQESNTAMGIVIDYIMRSCHWFGTEPKEMDTRDKRLAFIKTKFSSCKKLKEDLMKGFRFWKAVKVIFKVLSSEPNTINDELQQMFPLADQMLHIKLNQIIDLGEDADPEGPFVGASI